jgi:uncharacterized membrane protein HdeD (DUF308 family)
MSPSTTHKFKWKIFIAGLASIVLGYVLLGAANTTFAPLLLVLGYCVLVPLSFL